MKRANNCMGPQLSEVTVAVAVVVAARGGNAGVAAAGEAVGGVRSEEPALSSPELGEDAGLRGCGWLGADVAPVRSTIQRSVIKATGSSVAITALMSPYDVRKKLMKIDSDVLGNCGCLCDGGRAHVRHGL